MTVKIERGDQTTATPAAATPADFETAIDAAGFGIFNVLLLLAAIPAAMASWYETATMSFILPSAECHLKLSLLDKGILNAITYAGMVTSAILWGFMADTQGRKKLLVFGFLVNVLVAMCGFSSQSRIMLMVFKYIGGFIIAGPYAVLMSYLTELHGRKYRGRVMMLLGIYFALSSIVLPIIAMGVLPQQWNFEILGLKFASWQVFLAICGIPTALAGILFSFFPESPKFLMSQGRNDEALRVFQKIYALNYRKSRVEFPIKELANEVNMTEKKLSIPANENIIVGEIKTVIESENSENAVKRIGLHEGLRQLRPLFTKPYLGLSLQVYLLNFAALLGQSTMRLWLPQLFASIEEYTRNFDSGVKSSLCTILEYSVNKTDSNIELSSSSESMGACESVTSAASYTNNIIVGLSSAVGYIFASFLVNRFGSKRILTFTTAISGTCAILMYWSNSSLTTLVLSSVFVTFADISAMSIITSSVNLFPTTLRTMIVSLVMMVGRTGAIVGNVLFPAFMELGCIPPIVMLSFVMYFGSIMSIFLPNSNKAALK